MNEVIDNFTNWIEVAENAVFNDTECPSSFELKFCDGNELLDLYFSSKKIEVRYMLSSGETVVNSFNLQEFSDWLDS